MLGGVDHLDEHVPAHLTEPPVRLAFAVVADHADPAGVEHVAVKAGAAVVEADDQRFVTGLLRRQDRQVARLLHGRMVDDADVRLVGLDVEGSVGRRQVHRDER